MWLRVMYVWLQRTNSNIAALLTQIYTSFAKKLLLLASRHQRVTNGDFAAISPSHASMQYDVSHENHENVTWQWSSKGKGTTFLVKLCVATELAPFRPVNVLTFLCVRLFHVRSYKVHNLLWVVKELDFALYLGEGVISEKRIHGRDRICDCVLRYVVSFLLNVTITCHTDNICYFARVIDDDISPIREGIPLNFTLWSVIQLYTFTFIPHFTSLDTIHWRRKQDTITPFLSCAEAILWTYC